MKIEDLTAVTTIDALSFPTPARPGLFAHEIADNNLAHYQVLCRDDEVVGFAGYWLIGDEVHVSTIAVHPERRGQQLGELLLLNVLVMAYKHPVNMVTLEVRRSNNVAQQLYLKYGFDVVGERRRYYRDTGEDALIMSIPALNASYYQFLEQQQTQLFAHLIGEGSRP